MPQTRTGLVTYARLSDGEILDIMHTHGTYRNLKRHYDELYPRGASREDRTADQLAIIEYFDRPLMTDQEFLDGLREIMGDGPPICSTAQVARIHNLRAAYEFVPPNEEGRYPNYHTISVRIRVKGARERIAEGRSTPANELLPMTPEMMQKTFGGEIHAHRFLLKDVLTHHIGRWNMSGRIREGSLFLFNGREPFELPENHHAPWRIKTSA